MRSSTLHMHEASPVHKKLSSAVIDDPVHLMADLMENFVHMRDVLKEQRDVSQAKEKALQSAAPILALPEDGLMKAASVLLFIDVDNSTWFRWVKKGFAPAPIKIGGGTFWRAADIRQFIKNVGVAP